MIAPTAATVVAAALVAVLSLERAWMPAWLAALPRAVPPVAAAAITALAAVAIQHWTARRNAEADAERAAVAELQKHLGRQLVMPRIGQRGAGGLALRVHRAIPLAAAGGAGSVDVSGTELPLFVERDLSAEIRTWMRQARDTGGFLLLVGDSSVGKTRLLYESAAAELGDFVVLNPDLGDGNLVNEVAKATFPLPKTLVWLDELQAFLDGPYLNRDADHTPLTTTAVRQLLNAPTPIVVVATLWPEYAAALRATAVDPATGQTVPSYPEAVTILDTRQLHQLRVEPFSTSERERAAVLAARDPRLVAALADRDFNVTEALAGAPEIMRRYEQGNQEQRAVIHAAVDARRLGIQSTLTPDLLRAAARGYLTTTHPDDTWFDLAFAAVSRSTTAQDRATAPLPEVAGPDHAGILGVTVADYLLQHLAPARRAELLTGHTWQALIDHTHRPDDLERLADNMRNRLLYQYATDAYHRITDEHGIASVHGNLAELLAERGEVEELRVRADAGNEYAARQLARLLDERGEIEELRVRADAGDQPAQGRLAGLLADRGDLDQLGERADDGDQSAQFFLAELLAELDGLSERADAGDQDAQYRLASLLAERGDLDQLRERADAGDEYAQGRLASLLAERGDLDQLGERADAGDQGAQYWLAELLVDRGDLDQLGERADAGDPSAQGRLAGLLIDRGDLDQLRERADAGDPSAQYRLATLPADRDRLDQLRERADAGDQDAQDRLVDQLADRGDLEGAISVAWHMVRGGVPRASGRLVDLCRRRGDGDVERLVRFGLNPDGSVAGPRGGDDPGSTGV